MKVGLQQRPAVAPDEAPPPQSQSPSSPAIQPGEHDVAGPSAFPLDTGRPERLFCVVQRALLRPDGARSDYLFASTRRGSCYSRSGWGASWQDAMNAWIRTLDPSVRAADLVTHHPMYFALQDIRPTAVSMKLEKQAKDAYDFAGHASPSTTHKHYDRRRVRTADATE
ncbi:hypothetical protein [Achromobacter pulmonis]|nr:hypothetical protein [Achromobacter pulmonis]